MATLRNFVISNDLARQALGPHWDEILNPVDKMSISEVKALMDTTLIEQLLDSKNAGNFLFWHFRWVDFQFAHIICTRILTMQMNMHLECFFHTSSRTIMRGGIKTLT